MTEKFFSERNLKFQLYEVSDIESLTSCEYFEDYSRDSLSDVKTSAEPTDK